MGKIRTRMKYYIHSFHYMPNVSSLFNLAVLFMMILASNAVYSADGLIVESLVATKDQCPLTVTCEAKFSQPHEASRIQVLWALNGKDVGENEQSFADYDGSATYYLILPCDISNLGNLTCLVQLGKGEQNNSKEAMKSIQLSFPVAPKITQVKEATVNNSQTASLSCSAQGFPAPKITWSLQNENDVIEPQPNKIRVSNKENETYASSTLDLSNTQRSDNGTYMCHSTSPAGKDSRPVALLVQNKPEVTIQYAVGAGVGVLYLNWTLNNGNLPITAYHLKYMKEGTDQWRFSHVPPNVSLTSLVIPGLEPGVGYRIRIEAENGMGRSHHNEYPNFVETLSSEPAYTPVANFKGSTPDSFTLGWSLAPEGIRHLIGYYLASYKDDKSQEESQVRVLATESLPVHLFINLKPATMYFFRVKACNQYTDKCGNFSDTVNGTTIDGKPSAPKSVAVRCERDGASHNHYVTVSWESPLEPNGQVINFLVTLKGVAHYLNERWQEQLEDYGPMTKHVDGSKFTFRFDNVPPNTNYTIHVKAVTRGGQHGAQSQASCRMPASMPDKEKLRGITVSRYHKADLWGLRMSLPKVSQRKGPVCCYSVVLVKMLDGKSIASLPEPNTLPLMTYEDVHRQGAGAYIAELFDAARLPDGQIILGDESRIDKSNLPCLSCPGIFWPTPGELQTQSSRLVRRSSLEAPSDMINIENLSYDGILSPESNYTMFIRLFSPGIQGRTESVYSPYAPPMTPKPVFVPYPQSDNSVVLVVALGVLCGLALVLLLIVSSLLFLRRYSKHVAQSEGVEMSLSSSCRHLWSRFRDGGRHLLVSPPSTSAAPIPKQDLLQAFIERHQSADYGFQHEYEMLPERFVDRTTRASDTRENLPKNRYPDIKAYDQTRVKLNVINGDSNTDYINANIVMGYKERKKFVCAQGPMEGTVHDFWRMAWEQRVEIIVMLTNIEEYNKTKCFQYWPDPDPSRNIPTPEPLYIDPVAETQSNGGTNTHSPTNSNGTSAVEIQHQTLSDNSKTATPGDKMFGDIRVIHVKEKHYSEYVVRELQVSRPKTSTPTDPELGIIEREVRPVFQYHYLVWKDFQAPEHATGILRFLRRLNEDYSTDRGPILIHCSAGVGRTGTLVAIDHLIQQVEEEGCVSVFNTVCDLRHQRNFLVQSLRQYIFVYRTLMEWVQFGNTECSVVDFQDSLTKLRTKVEGRAKSLLEEEYERLTQLVDDRKPMSVSSSEENKAKNRFETSVPFDRNRVILTPVPGRDYSTYINASFVEGYDNSESFILTQDPMESTQRDFWRMVLEHNISVIVMLSEMDGGSDASCCLQYWPEDDQETTHDHIVVKHVSTVTLPSYIQRDFLVRNTRNREEMRTTQIQYLGWGHCPNGVEDETVPSPQQIGPFVSIGLETIATRSRQLQAGSACVHCSTGSIRSSLLVALCLLIEQARTEGYVDVFSTVRKLRSQRVHMVEHSSQYAFLYDALAHYLRTHPSSVPSSP